MIIIYDYKINNGKSLRSEHKLCKIVWSHFKELVAISRKDTSIPSIKPSMNHFTRMVAQGLFFPIPDKPNSLQ
jgi:hypothetical protein